jgi:protein-tyrosine phosphatase
MTSNHVPVPAASVPASTTPPRAPAWRKALSSLRSTFEQAVHPLRRKLAFERLQRTSPPASILFVCHGNIYRSPFAAYSFAAAVPAPLRTSLRVASAGFVGPDRPSPPDAQLAAQRRGLDMSQHRSRLVNGAMINDWDLVVVMESSQASELASRFGFPADRILVLGDLDREKIQRRNIADPWYSPETVLEPSYVRVERCVRVLADVLLSGASPNASSGK